MRSPWRAGSQGEHAGGPETSTDDLVGYGRRLEGSHPSQGLAVVPLVPSPVRRLPARSRRAPVLRPGHGLLLDFDDRPVKPAWARLCVVALADLCAHVMDRGMFTDPILFQVPGEAS